MVFKIDFVDGEAVTWKRDGSGVRSERDPGYRPRFYIEGDRSKLHRSRPWLTGQEGVAATSFETWRPTLSRPETDVLRVDCLSEEDLRTAVNTLKKSFGRSTFRFYNVGFSPQFRYCLQKELCPVPEVSLDRMEMSLDRRRIADEDISGLEVDGETSSGGEDAALELLERRLDEVDPDVLVVNRGRLLELLADRIEGRGFNFSLGRIDGFQELAGSNTVSSYGRRQHKPARYNVPGRIVIDRSNSFMLGEATLEGLWDLVERSYRPLQELAWGSIGRILTSIEVRKAYLERNTLTPWKNWDGEKPKKASSLHAADRGGFIFNPAPSVHRDVHEADFASLFPNIMVKKNISPETVCCDCCDNERVPELGYSICERREGFIGDVIQPLVEDRQEMKEAVRTVEDDERRRYLEGSIDAIKWILVSCFGYMGHAHASYGAIRCHQAIQAFDREIMLQAKGIFEEAGFKVAHGIIDSIWVQGGDREFERVCSDITREVGIELEPEHRFEWCAFVPRSSSRARVSCLNRYFGKKADGGFKTAGIEAEQRSTCPYVTEAQMEMIEALDREMDPGHVLEVLEDKVNRLESGEVPPEKLVVRRKPSKPLEAYSVENRTVSAMKRYRSDGIEIMPGQEVEYVVRDDSADPMDRTRLGFESVQGDYDPVYYRKELVRAAESVVSPLGVGRKEIFSRLEKGKQTSIASSFSS
ncbi:MAG: type B DNA-directed DNA polymerase [Candidatus Nanohaloarchaea archaeon]